MNYFEENIKPLPPQHNQQLLLLIDYFNNDNKLITNHYCINSDYEDSSCPAKFALGIFMLIFLDFNFIKQRIDLKQFVSFNWNHLVTLFFWNCGLFNDDDWRAIVEHADNFKNLKKLFLSKNVRDYF